MTNTMSTFQKSIHFPDRKNLLLNTNIFSYMHSNIDFFFPEAIHTARVENVFTHSYNSL